MKQLVIVLGALAVAGCSGMASGKRAAETEVVTFHRLYNAKKFEEIYSSAHEKMRNHTTEAAFLELIQRIREKLGKMTSTSSTGFNVRSINGTTTVILTRATTFEHGSARETFTYEMVGEKAELVGYNVKSDSLK